MRTWYRLALVCGLLSGSACKCTPDFDSARRSAQGHLRAGNQAAALVDTRLAIQIARAGGQTHNRELDQVLVHGGWLCLHSGCDSDALAWLDEAVALREQTQPPNEALLAQARGMLGVALVRQGKDHYDRAEEVQRKALAGWIGSRGPDDPHVATSLNNLGVLARRRGRLDEAEALHRRALAIRLAALGPDHPDVAQSHHNIGRTLLEKGDTAGAASSFERSGTPGPRDWFGLAPLSEATDFLGAP